MKKTMWMLALALAAGVTVAQAAPAEDQSGALASDSSTNSATFPIERLKAPTYADLYCAGFMTKDLMPNANYVAGGLHTPTTSKFVMGDAIFLSGSGFQAGQQFSVVRELKDVNEFEMFDGQRRLIKTAGHAYAELGRIRVLDTRSRMAVAQVEYSCEPIVPGDTLTPFSEKPAVTLQQPVRLDRFMPPNGKPMGRLILARDFDGMLGSGSKVYINLGSNQGVKTGDYIRAVRPYTNDQKDPGDSISFAASLAEDTQLHPASMDPKMFTRGGNGPVIHVRDFPRRAVGELVILSVTPTTSTAMVIFSLEDVHLGDFAEVE